MRTQDKEWVVHKYDKINTGTKTVLSPIKLNTADSSGSVSRLLSTLDILLPYGVLQCCLRAYSGVPVDSNNGFCEWMQTAHQAAAPEKPESHQVSARRVC